MQGRIPSSVSEFVPAGLWRNAFWDGVYLCLYACVVIRSVRNERIRCRTPRANCRHLKNNEHSRRWPRGGCRRGGGWRGARWRGL